MVSVRIFILTVLVTVLAGPTAAHAQGAPWWAFFLPRDNSALVRHDIPAAMTAGQEVDVSIEFRNTGRDAWRAANYRLGTVGDAAGHATLFMGANADPIRVDLPAGTAVGWRRTHVFRFRLRAPATPGVYVPQFRMVHEGVRWFGGTARRVVRVTPSAQPQPPPNPSNLPPIRIVGNRFEPPLFGMIACCNGPGPNDIAKGWPLAAPEWVDAFASAGANFTHVRTGPFSDQAYGWSLLYRLRDNVMYANSKGLYVEVDLVDIWAIARINAALYGDSCTLLGGPPPFIYRQWVREVVRLTGDLAVLYNIGNEGFKCNGASEAWEDGIYAAAKQALRDFGYPDRPVGSTFILNRIGRKTYDYVAQHGFGLQVPLSVPTILNETDNQFHSPPEWFDLVDRSRANGTYVAIWRGPLDDPEWNQILAHYGGSPYVVAPTKPSAGILRYPRNYAPGPDNDPTLVNEVAAAVERAIQAAPWLYTPDGNHLATNDDRFRVTHFSLVQHFLQPRMVEVGDPAQPWFNRVHLDVSRNPDPCPASEGVFESYHLIDFATGEIFRGGNIRNAFRGTTQHSGGPNDGCP